MEAPDLSVIVPTLDEAAALPLLLDQFERQDGVHLEVIVADGGSRDDTVELARARGARVVAAPRGRAAQMNAGARAATAPTLLFLHADSAFSSNTQLRDALALLDGDVARGGRRVAGHFALRFARNAQGGALFYRYLEAKTPLNRPGTINGDQGLLLRADFFADLGGFDERLPFLEDQRIAAAIFAQGRWITLPGRLATSARRFEREGRVRRYTLMSLIMGMDAAGAEAFFADAPRVYAAQHETEYLRLLPYLALAWRVLLRAGPLGALGILYRAGRYARGNAWQLFFWWDVLFGLSRRPALRLHDRFIGPVIANPVGDAVAAALIAIWFLVILPATYVVLDLRRRPS